METRDKVFDQFLIDYLRLPPELEAFSRRVLRHLATGASLHEATRMAAN